MTFPAFNSPWYAEIIQRFQNDSEDAPTINPALDGIGTAILAGFSILAQAADELSKVAAAITPAAAPGRDATGGTVISLTEAVMGVTAGLCRIAETIDGLASAVASNQD